MFSSGINYNLSLINFNRNSSTTQEDSPSFALERISNWKKTFK